MKKYDATSTPFRLLLVLCVALAVLSLVPTSFGVGDWRARPVDLFAQLRPPEDSLLAVQESLAVQKQLARAPVKQDSSQGYTRFFAALSRLQKGERKKVRIAWFGDSQIEADLITQDVRKMLQEVFGGQGVGYLPVTTVSANSRITVFQAFSQDWTDIHLLSKQRSLGLGISGHVFLPSVPRDSLDSTYQASWVSLTGGRLPGTDTLRSVSVLYGAGWTGNIISNRNYFPLSGKLSVNRVEVSNRPTTNLRMVFHMSHAQPIYGLVSEGGNGVYLDNFSFRGTTGLTLDRIPMSHLQGLNAIRPYDLIVLQYGVNVANYHTKGFEWYRKGMVKIIARLRTAFPKASILLIGTSDRGARIDGVLKTDPVIHSLLRTQRLLAQETGASFIDLFNGMGGEGSMIAWAQGDTVYANADFTHFNQRGSRRVGKILSDSLLGAWNHYRMNAKAPEVLR